MPRLYGTYRSRATRNLWLAGEIGLDLPLVPVWQAYRLSNPTAPDAPLNTLSPAFLAISPQGAIPVLDDNGLILSESLAINLHLARVYGGALGPQNASESALMEQWTLFGATSIEEPSLALQYVHSESRADTPQGQAEIAQNLQKLTRPLNVLQDHLTRQGQIVGHRFTVADVNVAEVVRYATAHPGALDRWPAVRDWLAACQSRPAFQDMWAKRLAEPVNHPG